MLCTTKCCDFNILLQLQLDPDFTTMGLEDPSEIYRPKPPQFELEKAVENFRDYENLDGEMIRVRDTYFKMHKNQTHQFACDQVLEQDKWDILFDVFCQLLIPNSLLFDHLRMFLIS